MFATLFARTPLPPEAAIALPKELKDAMSSPVELTDSVSLALDGVETCVTPLGP